jgi:putative hemolysin
LGCIADNYQESTMITEISIIFLLILANAVFSLSEMAIVSSRKVRLQQLINQGDKRAKAALELAESPNHFFSIVQVGIILINILNGVFGGATLAKRLGVVVSQIKFIPYVSAYSEPISFGIVVLLITYFALIIGELVPKRVALNNPEKIALLIAVPMRFLAKLALPIVHLLSLSTDAVLKILGIKPSLEPQVTEEEIKILIEQGTEAGTFEEAEQDMVERVFRLGDRPVSYLMTPRPDIVWLDLADSPEENRQKMIENGYSRYPVCQEELDHVLGVIPVVDLLARSLSNEPFDLTMGLRQPVFIPESTRGLKVLELFKQTVTHMALVVDEYGVIQGLVTLNDIMSEIVGDVSASLAGDEPQAIQREDGSWLVDGMLSVEEFGDLFNISRLDMEEHGNYQTLGGFIITHLGRIPATADHFEWRNMRFEVVDMDGNRVDKILITVIP